MIQAVYHLQERRTGKTRDSISAFLASPNEALYVTFPGAVKEIRSIVGHTYKNQILSRDDKDNLIGRRYSRLIVDDYDFMDAPQFLHSVLACLDRYDSIEIRLTPEFTFKKTNYYTVQFLDSKKVLKLINSGALSDEDTKELKIMSNNFIFHKDMRLIDHTAKDGKSSFFY